MPRKRPTAHDMLMRYFLRHQAGIDGHRALNTERDGDIDELPSLNDRLRLILDLVNKTERNSSNMIFFVMYDIASNKVRRAVVKYRIRPKKADLMVGNKNVTFVGKNGKGHV